MYFEMLFYLGIVIGLAIVSLVGIFVVRSYARGTNPRDAISSLVKTGPSNRLRVVQQIHLDARRKLVLVRRDDVEHLLIIGGTHDVVVETGIEPPKTDETNGPATAKASTQR